MPSRVGLLILLLVAAVACTSPGVPAPAPSPAASPQSAIATNAPAPAAATPGPTVLPTLPPGASASPLPGNTNAGELARMLAARVAAADNPDARYRALLEVLDALNFGVYSLAGEPVLRGAERNAKDFFLYESEVRMIAASLATQDHWSLAEMAALLDALGFSPGPEGLAPATLYQAMLRITRDAAQAPGERSAAILLVRELGLRQPQPYDLLQAPPLETLTFNALQRVLILADAVLPVTRRTQGWRVPAAPNAPLILKPVALQDACASIRAGTGKADWHAGQLGTELYPGVSPESRQALLQANEVVKRLHHAVLQIWLNVERVSPVEQKTHYGHGQPGDKLEFKVRVTLRDARTNQIELGVVRCGALTGVGLAEQGVGNIYVNWRDDGNINKHGRLTCANASCAEGTGPDGTVTLVFEPKAEQPPSGWGPVSTVSGRLWASIGAVGKLPANIQDRASSPGFNWTVGFHRQPRLTLTFDSKIDGTSGAFWATSHASAEVPLDYDPHAMLWKGAGPMTYETKPKPGDPCRPYDQWEGKGATTLQVSGNVEEGESGGINPRIQFYVAPGQTVATNTGYHKVGHPPVCVKFISTPTMFFAALWWISRLNERNDAAGGWRVPPEAWTFTNAQSGEYARAASVKNCQNSCAETTVLTLVAETRSE